MAVLRTQASLEFVEDDDPEFFLSQNWDLSHHSSGRQRTSHTKIFCNSSVFTKTAWKLAYSLQELRRTYRRKNTAFEKILVYKLQNFWNNPRRAYVAYLEIEIKDHL